MSKINQPAPDRTAETSPPVIDDRDLILPEDLRRIRHEHEMALLKESLERERKHQREQAALHDAFMNQHLRKDAKEYFTATVRAAAERGQNEIELFRFPSRFCSDEGRRINRTGPTP